MTENNKPIMIDNVDVNGCEDYGYRGNAGYWCHYYDEPCTDYSNCNFKQLARKTQECEELKNKNNILKEHSRYYKNEGKRCKKEIGKLKAKKERAERKFERIKTLISDNDNYFMKEILQIIDEVK